MTTNTIAAIIPLYNKEPYIARAITSVLAQTRAVEEIIVVDDVSTDGSAEQVLAFCDPRIQLVRRSDPAQRGLPATRNVGIRAARSRWIALLDADDRWHDHFIEEVHDLLSQASERVGCLFTGWENVWPDGRVIRDKFSASFPEQRVRQLDFDAFVSEWLRYGGCPIFPSGVVLRRDILVESGLFLERCRRGEDKEMWLRVIARSDVLCSSRVCSSYHHGIPGQMNYAVTTNMRHCICATLENMIAASSGTRRRLLMRLFNHEVYQYARAVGLRERLSPEVYRGYFVSLDPLRYFLLLALTYIPLPLQRLMRQVVLGTHRIVGRLRSRPAYQ
jgi:succinoglycan biosynthesis protein ExoO